MTEWRHVIAQMMGAPVTAETVALYYSGQARYAQGGELRMMQVERDGGECPICHVPWRRVAVRNAHADYVYHDPVCDCHPRCPRCGVSLHREAVLGHLACGCGWDEADARLRVESVEQWKKMQARTGRKIDYCSECGCTWKQRGRLRHFADCPSARTDAYGRPLIPPRMPEER